LDEQEGAAPSDAATVVGGIVDRVRTAVDSAPGTSPHIAVSRGASPQLREALTQFVQRAGLAPLVEADAVRGRAVWATAPAGIVVVEQPNWWGRLEELPPGAIVLDHRGPDWAQRVRRARRVARSVAQVPGVTAAHGTAEAPWFVVLLPVAQEAVAEALVAAGITGALPIDRRHAELPGGLRLAPPEIDQDVWVRSCVACVGAVAGKLRASG
jgi:hypothetical protein